MKKNAEAEFFDSLAAQWDTSRAVDFEKLTFLLSMMDISRGAHVLDVGSGTGVLLPYLKDAIGSSGSITALDFSKEMLARAQEKYEGLEGINYVCDDVLKYETKDLYDVVVCLNFFPHIKDKTVFLHRMKQFLKPKAMLVVMHDISRQAVNAIHQGCAAVQEDRLPGSKILAKMLEQAGYRVQNEIDCEKYYFVKAIRE